MAIEIGARTLTSLHRQQIRHVAGHSSLLYRPSDRFDADLLGARSFPIDPPRVRVGFVHRRDRWPRGLERLLGVQGRRTFLHLKYSRQVRSYLKNQRSHKFGIWRARVPRSGLRSPSRITRVPPPCKPPSGPISGYAGAGARLRIQRAGSTQLRRHRHRPRGTLPWPHLALHGSDERVLQFHQVKTHRK